MPGPREQPGRRLVRQGDRLKAYRPLPPDERQAALEAGLAAYAAGEFFEAHELLEPAWMGTDDLAERALHQGLIKLAAGYVHRGRHNPEGVRKNLEGALRHLRLAGAAGDALGIDVAGLVADLEDRLASLPRDPVPGGEPPAIRRTRPA